MLFTSNLLANASGKLGGSVFSHNAGGAYIRNGSPVTNPQTAAQIAVRNTLANLSQQWSGTLTQQQRDDWAAYAAQKPVVNAVGNTVYRSGSNWFVGSNSARLRGTGLSVVLDAPSTGAQAPILAPVVDSISAATNIASVSFLNTQTWANEDGGALIIYASRPVSPGVNFFKGPYLVASTVLGDATTAPTSPAAVTLPFNVNEGDKVFFKAVVVTADGGFSEMELGFQLSGA